MVPSGRRLFLALAIAIFTLDQITKAAATAWLAPRDEVTIIPGFLDLAYVRNTGAVFGMFRSLADPWRSLILTLVPLLALALVIAMALRTPPTRLRVHGALGLILGGALGNLLDRLRLGSVVDFIEVYVGRYHWPNFNAADSAICVGVGLLVFDMWRSTGDS
ncbi:MAG: signal peptidase II [Acidobacteria bacterium]|nr:signal peptidase II [Acidobacteriota bacterium]